MSFVITSECVNCGLCVDTCPISAIIEGEERYVITDSCIQCGACQDVCPVEAIKST
jgi:formate hydrogenlyase subunit 6/NADH:ubiquinone oxidoreductase subunit I